MPHSSPLPRLTWLLVSTMTFSWALSACQPGTTAAPAAPLASTTTVSAAPDPAQVASAAALARSQALQQQVLQKADAVLARHRQMIVLMSSERPLKVAERRAVTGVGETLFHESLAEVEGLMALISNTSDPATLGAVAALLDKVESEPSWFDADRLAFKDVLTRLAQQWGQAQSIGGLKLAKRASEDLTVLGEIELAYDKELKEVFGRFAKRGIELKREKWSDYLTKLRMLYNREQILKDHGSIIPHTHNQGDAGDTDAREVFGSSLPPKTVVLTFDDGPHPRFTDEILEILKRYDAPAIFFHLGRNLGTVDAGGHPQLGAQSAVAKRVRDAGHLLANHSFSHNVMTKLDEGGVHDEAAHTEALLDAVGRDKSALFRFPYGARNAEALGAVESLQLRSMMWSVDSMDWADPVPKSIAERVLSETDKAQRGVILFHDIQGRTVQALPIVLDQLVADGYRFATWHDGKFLLKPPQRVRLDATVSTGNDTLYRRSHAVVIGIDKYTRWPGLQHAVRDAQAIQKTLIQRFGFAPENVTTLLDGDATRANILKALNNEGLADGSKVKADDRVMVFFAGHGSTRKLPSGRDVGYIIPVDASVDNLPADAISMPQLQEASESITAKHVLFMVDACYSGLGLTRGGSSGTQSKNFLKDNARRQGRQMLTAGGADQQVADDGPGGHSVFTWTVLQALGGKADMNGDGVITGTELASYVAPAVSSIARQTPAFGSLPGSEGGEFVFELPTEREALSTDSLQLDTQASALNKRLDEALQAPATVPGKAPAPLQVTVKNLEGIDTKLSTPSAAPLPPRVAAQRANDRGLSLYRERRYDEAEAAFTEALKLQPKFPLAANNLGFIYFKRGQPVEAARWFEKSIEMDGSRTLAYLNLGDAYLQHQEDAKALQAYTTFLGLSPQHPRSASLRAWVNEPDKTKQRPVLP